MPENILSSFEDLYMKSGLKPEHISELLSVDIRTVYRWIKGEVEPKAIYLKELKSIISNMNGGARFQGPKNSSFTFIDLFAGIGGIRLPFQELGGECVFTSELDKFAQKTYTTNFGEVPSGDITKIPAEDIAEHDVLLAGFPCQAFSQAGLKQGFMDTRGTMFFEIQRILAHHRPKAFLLENVKQLRGHNKGQTLKTIVNILQGNTEQSIPDDVPMSDEARESLSKKLNYWVDFKVLRAADYGVPQNRERVYIVGFDRDYFKDTNFDFFYRWPEALNTPTRLGDILFDNKDVDDKYTISDRLWEGHQRRKKEHKEKGNGFGYSLFTHESPYASTISARYYKDGSEILIDQSDLRKNPRKLTPRECARLQGFPDNYTVDSVSDAQAYKQFGNSVAVPVIRAVAQSMVDIMSLDQEEIKDKAA